MAVSRKDIIIGSKDKTKAGIDSAKRGLKGVGTSWMQVAKGMLAFNVFVQLGKSAINFVKGTMDAFAKQELAVKKLSAAMEQHGVLTQEALQHNLDYASSLQKITTYGDEDIIMLQSLLTSYGLVGDELDKAVKSTLDMASATKMDLKAAGLVMGKAAGGMVSSLGRYIGATKKADGTTMEFTEALDKMNSMFGGAAQAEAQTYAGQMKQLGNIWGDLKEMLGKFLVPAILAVVGALKTAILWVQDFIKVIQNQGEGVKKAGGFLNTFVNIIKALIGVNVKIIKTVFEFIRTLFNFGKTVSRVLGITKFLGDVFRWLIDIIVTFGKTIANVINTVLTPFKFIIDKIGRALSWLKGKMEDYSEAHQEEGKKIVLAERKKVEAFKKTEKEFQFTADGIQTKAEETTDKLGEEAEKTTAKLGEEADKQKEKAKLTDEQIAAAHQTGLVDKIKQGIKDLQQANEDGGKTAVNTLKKRLKGEIAIWEAAEIAKAIAANWWNFGLLAIPMIAVIVAAASAGRSVIDSVALQKGGIVTKETSAIIGETGPEAVIPLDSERGKRALGGMGAINITINVGAFMGNEAQAMEFAKMIQFQIKKINRREITV